MNHSFKDTLFKSIRKTNAQIFVLLKVVLAIGLYLIRDFLIVAVLFAAGIILHSRGFGLFFEILSIFYFGFIAVKLDGAIGLALAYISLGETAAMQIAKKSTASGLSFFVNALRTGVLLVFGQILLVCPCFLLLNNFIFSPFLSVYEGVSGRQAKKRSVELASGFGWMMLNRTAIMIFTGYVLIAVVAIVLILKLGLAGIIILTIFCFYLALIQSNLIRAFYEQTLELHKIGFQRTTGKYKFITAASVFVILVIYIGLHKIK